MIRAVSTLEVSLTPQAALQVKHLRRVKTHTRKDHQLVAALQKSAKRFAPAWRQGIQHADDHGQQALALLEGLLVDTAASVHLSTTDAALLASAVGAYESSDLFLYAELLWRGRGPALCVAVLSEMWRFATDYSSSGRAIWLRQLGDTDQARLDASVSYAKGAMARFLYERQEHATATQRDALRSAAGAWRASPFHVQVPIAVAVRDAAWADALIDRLKTEQHPGGYARQLMHVTEDPDRIQWLVDVRGCHLGLPLVLRLSPETALALYERQLNSSLPRTVKSSLLQQIANLRGPAVARLLARFAERRPFQPHVRAYFVQHPELLQGVIDAPGDDIDAEALVALQKAVSRTLARKTRKR